MVKYGYRDLPTLLHPNLPSNADPNNLPVTLTTTLHQDALAQLRENLSARQEDGRMKIDRSTHADMDPLTAFVPLYRPGPRSTFYRLPSLRPSVLWILGERTYLRLDEMREGIKITGPGIGGSGGVAEGQVKEVVVKKQRHLLPFEEVIVTAKECSTWLMQEMEKFMDAEKLWNDGRATMSVEDHMTLIKSGRKR